MIEADPKDIPQVRDRRPKIAGLLPKNAQNLAIGAIALVMVVIILFSGRSAPKAKNPPKPELSEPILEPSPARIQDYRARIEEQARKLAAEEAQLAQTKAAFSVQAGEAAHTPQLWHIASPLRLCFRRPGRAREELDRA